MKSIVLVTLSGLLAGWLLGLLILWLVIVLSDDGKVLDTSWP